MHPGGVRSAMDLFDFEKSANLKHPSGYAPSNGSCRISLFVACVALSSIDGAVSIKRGCVRKYGVKTIEN